jgi:hypothetical protein
MKKKWASIFLCLCMLVLSGCFPTGKVSSPQITSGTSDLTTIPSSINTELSKNLIVKADVSIPDQHQFKNASIMLKKFDSDVAMRNFLSGKEISQTNNFKNSLFPEYIGKSFQCSDGTLLTVGVGNIQYSTKYYDNRQYDSVIFGSNYFVRPNIKSVYKKTELAQLDKDDAVATVKSIISSLDIAVQDIPEVIALDYDTLQSEWKNITGPHGENSVKWETSDEAYVVVFTAAFDNTPITQAGYRSENNTIGDITGSRILGVVTKNGLIYFQCKGIYDKGETIKDSIKPVSLPAALEQVKKKYKDVLLTDPVNITHIALEYIPQAANSKTISFELVPAWVFTTSQETTVQDVKGSYKITSYFPIIVLAQSGQELVIRGVS